MIRYHFDLYPRDDPRDGARVVRFTKLQSAEYRGEANGTGSGRFSIRADTDEAQNIDPAGLQYVRVVREDTVAATETVVGGFFLDSGDFVALDERGTRLLTFGGAGTLSYLARPIMASHTYANAVLPSFYPQDPMDDTWRLYSQSTVYAGGNYLGAMLWRVLIEAQNNVPGTHRHADGVNVTDTHSNDRPTIAIPDLVLGFDQFDDSNGADWTLSSGEFKAQVGENVLAVVKRLMEAGLYVEMDPDTFELNAYQAATHRRTRTGASWGANVIRFQAPTAGDISTGNIKSDAKRAIAAFIKRSWVLAGGQDVYGDATGTTDIPWEGFYNADVNDATAAAGIASVQVGARDDAGDTVRLRIRLGTTPATGYYLPFEHILLDDLVTLHTGTGQWDFNEQTFPVAAITVALRTGGDWDCWADLGSSYAAAAGRQFQVSPVAAHNHGPNPELCRPGIPATPTLVSSNGQCVAADANPEMAATISGAADGVLYVAAMVHPAWTVTATWYPDGHLTPGTGQVMTLVESVTHGAAMKHNLYRLLAPTAGVGEVGLASSVAGGIGWGYWYVTGRSSDTFASASGTGSSSSISIAAGANTLVLDAAGWGNNDLDPSTDPTSSATEDWAAFFNDSSGLHDTQFGGSHGSSSPSWTFDGSRNWGAVIVAVTGSGSGGDGPPELIGTSVRASRCDHNHIHNELLERDDADAHAASSVTVSPFSTIAATNVQAALEEIAAEAGGGVTDHGALTGLTDDDHPQYLKAFGGGEDDIHSHGNTGAAETFDPADGNWHTATLDANCTFTLTAPTSGKGCTLMLELTQDGTGGRAITLPASVTNRVELEAAQVTTASTTAFLLLWTRDGGTTWYGSWVGGSSVGALDDLSDVTITSPSTAQRLRYDGVGWVNSSLKWIPVTTYDGTNWLPAVDGSGNAIMTEA